MARLPRGPLAVKSVRQPSRHTSTFVAALLVLGAASLTPSAQEPPRLLETRGNVNPVHDPVIIKADGTYYVFCTGGRNGAGVIPIRVSKDMQTWEQAGFVFPDRLPAWTATEVPRATNAWAPDISFYNGRYHLYYSVSSFGSRDSAIGLVTNRTLNPASP